MEHFSFPPGPKLPAALQAAWLAYRPYRFLERCRDAHGDAFTIATTLGRVAVFARPDYVERVFELDGVSLLGGAAQGASGRLRGRPVADEAGRPGAPRAPRDLGRLIAAIRIARRWLGPAGAGPKGGRRLARRPELRPGR